MTYIHIEIKPCFGRRKLRTILSRAISFFILLVSFQVVSGQLSITASNSALPPESLVETVFLGDGVEVTNITYDGADAAVGFFTDGLNEIGIDRGLMMSSGFVINGEGITNDFASDATNGPTTDVDLEVISEVPLHDVSRYEITFIPTSDTLRFKYVFASEEYPEYGCSAFNDVFGFFITGPDPAGGTYNGKNIALVPDASDPSGTTFTNLPVSIANVHGTDPPTSCVGSNENFYNDNAGSAFFAYDGYLDVFIAQAIVIPCEEYTIKLAIADGSDKIFDSGVFLEAKSFGTGSLKVEIETVSLDGGLAEGCDPGVIVFSLANAVEEDLVVDANIITCANSATADVDYFGLPDQFIIPAGESSISFVVTAIEDGINEGDEFICFDIQRDICNRDTVSIKIVESPLKEVFVPNDTIICQNELIYLKSTLPDDFILPESPNFTSTFDFDIDDELVPNTFPINVSGIVPDYLTQGMIKAICIDTIEHRYLNDLDLYLIAPDGQFLELSTDNGFKPMNGADIDYMVGTCFTPYANTNVNNGNSLSGPIFPANPTYLGNFEPEGYWDDLFDDSYDSNGEYQLLVIDDETGATGRITGWSICFEPIYRLEYQWSSDIDGLICINCVDFPVSVAENTTFYLDVFDSYGCTTRDSFLVTVNDLLAGVTNMVCDSVSPNFIRITWDGEPTADSYEVFIPGVIDPAINIGNVEEFDITGLDPLTDYEISIKVIGGICGGETVTITCTTVNCEVDDLVVESIEGVLCFGDANGSLDVVITGNYPPFIYEFQSMTDPQGEFSGLVAGLDTLYITDFTGCVSKYPITIPGPNDLNINFNNIVDISCHDESDGMATADPFGGTSPYSFIWSSGEVTAAVTMLEVGMNYVTVTDENGCTKVDSINFTNPSEMTATHLLMDADCFEDDSGIGIISANGGTGGYSYAWGDPLNQTTQQANDLFANTYLVTITDNNGCSITEEVVIGQPDEIETNVEGMDVPCFNDINGTGTVTVSGGTSPYDFLWDNGSDVNPTNDLTVGKHYVTITDDNGCSVIDSVVIGAPPAIEVDFMNNNVTCFDGADGIVTWLAFGGTGTLVVTNDDGDLVSSPLIGLVAGEYCFVFTDESLCALDTCINLTQPIEIVVDNEISLETCFNSNDAEIDITASNGVEPYTYSWEGPLGFVAISEDIIGVNSGLYAVTVTDNNGCTKVETYTLDEPLEIVISATVLDIACKGDAAGTIQITVEGGVEPYMYSWIGPNGFTSDDEDLIDLLAGTYTLIFTDSVGCVIQKDYEIIEPVQGIIANISGLDEVCFDKTNGIASVAPFGGTQPYDITWSTGSKFSNINGLAPGWYVVTVIDGSNCTTVDSVEILERPEILITLDQTSSFCFESFDGTAQVIAIIEDNQTQDLDEYEYLWNSFPIQNTSSAVNLKGGADYLVVVTDELGCTGQQQVIIETPDEITAELLSIDSINCALGDDGNIIIDGRGGNGVFTYQWGQDANYQDGAAAKNLKAGTYDVTITDSNGCTGVEEFEITDPFPITLNYRIFDVLCYGDDDGEVELIANGGTVPYNFNWSNSSHSDVITELEKGFYKITVTDAKGCVIVDSVFVDEPLEPLTLSASVLNITCADGQDGSIIVDAEGGSGSYIYSLDNFIFNGSVEQIGLSEGLYTVYVKDANGCLDSIADIDIFSPAPLELELGPDVYLSFGENYQLDPTINNFQGPLLFDWNSPDLELLSCDDCQNPFFDAIRQATYQLIVRDARGCLVEDFINIYIENDDAIFVPTGFSPNNDFNNDLLNVFGMPGVKVKTFRVLDRWGEVMYENTDFMVNDKSIGWDGSFKGKEMMPGVYTWVVEGEFTNGFIKIYSGNTTLIK